jgi:endoglucanase
MKKIVFYACLCITINLSFCQYGNAQKDVVSRFGHLSVLGHYMVGQYKDTVQLRGMSLFWSQWMPQYYNAETIAWLKNDWKCTVIRVAMGVDEDGGYAHSPATEEEKVCTVVDAAIEQGIYVIIDYHSHQAHKNPDMANKFFTAMAKKYGKYPNVIYEIYNEPLQDVSWTNHIKPYADELVATIRAIDPDNIIIVGTRQWSQMVTEAAANPIKSNNIMYTLHFYAVSHGQYLRDEAEKAMNMGIALFVTEFGDCDYSGDGELGYAQTEEWFAFMDKYKLSWCNWSVSDKKETASILKPRSGFGNLEDFMITPSGKYIREELIKKYTLEMKKKK